MDAVSGTDHSPLQLMLMLNRTECLMELLCYGASCNIGDSNGDTPLHIAVQVRGHTFTHYCTGKGSHLYTLLYR